jgi:hypothetical protein
MARVPVQSRLGLAAPYQRCGACARRRSRPGREDDISWGNMNIRFLSRDAASEQLSMQQPRPSRVVYRAYRSRRRPASGCVCGRASIAGGLAYGDSDGARNYQLNFGFACPISDSLGARDVATHHRANMASFRRQHTSSLHLIPFWRSRAYLRHSRGLPDDSPDGWLQCTVSTSAVLECHVQHFSHAGFCRGLSELEVR